MGEERMRVPKINPMDSYQVLNFVIAHLTMFLIVSLYLIGMMNALSIEENMELDRKLFFLNRLAVKTIKTKYGDIYNCMDLYKQPALFHPSLKDQKIQMRPSFTSQVNISVVNRSMDTSINIGLKDGCPSGTVPIRRMTKEELLSGRANFQEHFQGSYSVNSAPAGFIFAGISTAKKQTTQYHGAGGYIAICNPTAGPGQFSGSAISIEGGPDDQFSVIRVGWLVNVNLYHDNRTRLYTIWGQGVNGAMHGCYNTYCSGFVQTNAQIPLDMVLEPISVLRGTQYYVKLGVNQDKATGNWWLRYGESETPIGYWSSSLFTNLNNGGDILRWGGMIYSSTPQLPPMGNGDNGDIFSAHFRHVSLSYESGSSLNGTMDVPLEVLGTRCYKAGDNSYKNDYWGYSFYFGGDGGNINECSK